MRYMYQLALRSQVWGHRSLPALGCGLMLLPPQIALAQARQDDSVLAHHGHLKLRYYAIHGAAPLILILTQAPGSVALEEGRYRAMFTDLLTADIEGRGFSYYVLRSVGGDTISTTPEQTVERLEIAASEVAAALRRKHLPPSAYVGLAEGAVVAARLATRDSLPPRALAALAPSLPADARKGAPRWDEVIQAVIQELPLLLAIQSVCDGPMPDSLINASRRLQRLLILPNHDSWLAPMRGTSCTGKRPLRVPGLNVAHLVTEWLGASIIFPQ